LIRIEFNETFVIIKMQYKLNLASEGRGKKKNEKEQSKSPRATVRGERTVMTSERSGAAALNQFCDVTT
jgi:hypothetical protein